MSTINTPFDYPVGINYESWTMGRTNMDIQTDLTEVAKYFSLIKTFHCATVGTTTVEMDPTQQQVIDFVTGYSGQTLQLIMGTNNSALAQGGFGTPWSAGLMTSSTYTDKWVTMLIQAFGDVNTTLKHLKCICLGNEIDQNGPPPSDSTDFNNYLNTWLPTAFDNLKTSLNNQGLGDLPVTTIIANYPLTNPSANKVASQMTTYVNTNWSSNWNGGKAFVFFNQYTQNGGQSTNFNTVSTYFNNVENTLGTTPQVFVGETGYSAEFGLSNEITVIDDMFTWLDGEMNTNGICTPLCVFQAFDHPGKPAGQQQMGLFTYNGTVPALKSGLNVPSWVNTPVSATV